jgi:hypothetical protein
MYFLDAFFSLNPCITYPGFTWSAEEKWHQVQVIKHPHGFK